MKIAPRTRRWALFAALPLAAAAALRANNDDEAASRERSADARPRDAVSAATAATREREALPHVDMERLQALPRRHVSEQPFVDPFFAGPAAAPDSAQTAETAAPPPPPPPPEAPALPFRFIGRQDADGVPLIFLEQQEQIHIVRIGETVADAWRLDKADDQALVFTYVPLGQQRKLATGSSG
ncbi:MAG: hypothetical protein GEV05_09905 [Betaproteobacteria bacterium]|nr:hypothetical protein [Betaproteobacteria bacterium]